MDLAVAPVVVAIRQGNDSLVGSIYRGALVLISITRPAQRQNLAGSALTDLER
jgi:hypothetical protein